MKSRLLLCSLVGALSFAGCLDRKTGGSDGSTSKIDTASAPSGDSSAADSKASLDTSSANRDVAVPESDLVAAPDVEPSDSTSADVPVLGADAPLVENGGADGGGAAPGAGGTTGAGGKSAGGTLGSGGTLAAGGVVASGGVAASGGVVTSGGVVASGGKISSGGTPGTGGTSCVAKSRDCTSSLDNDCNGTPDNQETAYCACPVAQTRACQEHPGFDGVGICKAGSQSCVASTDKATSSWGACNGAVGPGTEVCDAARLDENCNGQSNEGCQCVSGTETTCGTCGGTAPCNNGILGPCSKGTSTFYRDADLDGYGFLANSITACSAPSGYVANHSDCDDGDSGIVPGYSTCGSNDRRYCDPAGSGSWMTEACASGCLNGACRSDGTIGYSGIVSCWSSGGVVAHCSTAVGCTNGACGTSSSPGQMTCDGPNDCGSGQVCCSVTDPSGHHTSCLTGSCSQDRPWQVCDPQVPSSCPAGQTCQYGDAQLHWCG
jgi:hypothetical protein